jgi:hypothetical protein
MNVDVLLLWVRLRCAHHGGLKGVQVVVVMEEPIIKLGGCMLACKSQLISSICLTTAEAEYKSLSHCLRARIPIKRTLIELASNLGLSVELKASISSRAFGDNTAASVGFVAFGRGSKGLDGS